MNYYHLVVEGKDKTKAKLINEHSLDEINDLAQKYLSKKDFWVEGVKFDYDNVKKFSVYKTDCTTDEIITILYEQTDPAIIMTYDDYDALKNKFYSINISNSVLNNVVLIVNDSKTTQMENKNVFIVYGRDENLLNEVKLLVTQLGLKPILISNEPDKGRSIFGKIKDSVNKCCYSIVLWTPDDVGSLATETEKIQFRARENVLIELGYVVAKLGEENVTIIKKGNPNIPTDIQGLALILREESEWKNHLYKNLKEVFKDISSDDIL